MLTNKCDQPNVFDPTRGRVSAYADCPKPGEFVIFDEETGRDLTFCQDHIGEHLHYCTSGEVVKVKRLRIDI